MKKLKNAYSALLVLSKKYNDIYEFSDNISRCEQCLKWIEIVEKNNIQLSESQVTTNNNYISCSEYSSIYTIEENRSISWEDDGKKPKIGTYVFNISFGTGAYIFGEDYPTEFFKKFFAELKGYKPDYIDSANKSLYWEIKNASKIYNEFGAIFEKYKELNREDIKQRRIKKMEAELKKLKN